MKLPKLLLQGKTDGEQVNKNVLGGQEAIRTQTQNKAGWGDGERRGWGLKGKTQKAQRMQMKSKQNLSKGVAADSVQAEGKLVQGPEAAERTPQGSQEWPKPG